MLSDHLLVGVGFLAANPRWLDRRTDHVERTYDLKRRSIVLP